MDTVAGRQYVSPSWFIFLHALPDCVLDFLFCSEGEEMRAVDIPYDAGPVPVDLFYFSDIHSRHGFAGMVGICLKLADETVQERPYIAVRVLDEF